MAMLLINAVSGKIAINTSKVTFMLFCADKNGVRYLKIRFCESSNDLFLCYKDKEPFVSGWVEKINMNQPDNADLTQCEFENSLDGIFEAFLEA